MYEDFPKKIARFLLKYKYINILRVVRVWIIQSLEPRLKSSEK